jgi:hypothetical protein
MDFIILEKTQKDYFTILKIGRFEIWYGGDYMWNIKNKHSLYFGKLNIEYR